LWRPEQVFGVYDTEEAPTDDNGLGEAIIDCVERLVKRVKDESRYSDRVKAKEGRRQAMQGLGQVTVVPGGEMFSLLSIADEIGEKIDELENVVSEASEIAFSGNGKKKRIIGRLLK
jgi:hypothetical protein